MRSTSTGTVLRSVLPSTSSPLGTAPHAIEATHVRTGEIDFEEFLLVIKNMQNPGAVQSKLGVAVQKGVKKGVFQTTMKGGA